MKRRNFVKGLAIAAIAVPLASNIVTAKPEVYPWIEEALESKRSGQTPNYLCFHVCPDCGSRYLCPDRYTRQRCEPMAFAEEKGWSTSGAFACLPCIASLDEANAAAWREAHEVKKAA